MLCSLAGRVFINGGWIMCSSCCRTAMQTMGIIDIGIISNMTMAAAVKQARTASQWPPYRKALRLYCIDMVVNHIFHRQLRTGHDLATSHAYFMASLVG